MTRDEIFAAIVAWTKSSPAGFPATEEERVAWVDAQDGIATALEASNDAEWLRIIADAVLGALLRRLPADWLIEHSGPDEGIAPWCVWSRIGGVTVAANTPDEALTKALEKEQANDKGG